MKRLFKCFALLFLCFYTSIAQEGLKKHTVSSGETLFSIAKKYNVTPYDLQKVNPNVINGIKVDEVLLIPESKIKTPVLESAADSIKASVRSSSISHTVKKGETKFSLSKRFDLTISELESQNPQIIHGLNIGDVLEIYPGNSYTATKESIASSKPSSTPSAKSQSNIASPNGKRHVVVSGETLWRIASANGLTVDQLVNANSRVLSRGLIAGQILWIPSSQQLNVSGNSVTYVVKNGDTKFGLSRRFNTTIRELERNNPHIKNLLEIGHVITMPYTEGTTSTNDNLAQSEIQTKTQTTASIKKETPVEPVETDPNIKETIGITEEPPKIKETVTTVPDDVVVAKEDQKEVEVSPTNTEIVVTTKEQPKEIETVSTVPEKTVTPETQPIESVDEPIEDIRETTTVSKEKTETPVETPIASTSETQYVPYEIQPKETLYGLAQKAGMSIDDFLILNPRLKESVQAGTFIKMPNSFKPTQASSQNAKAPGPITDYSIPVDLKATANTSQFKKLLFFLPFSQTEYQNYEANSSNFSDISDDFKRVNLEFYKGANIAIDSIKKMYLSLDVDVIELQSTVRSSKILPLLEKSGVNDYDAIILPYYDNVEEEIAAFTADNNIPVITASTMDFQSGNDNLFSAVPSINLQRQKVLDYIMSKDAHIIVLNDASRSESRAFISKYAPQADFINIKKNGSFSEGELIGKFKKDQLNYVIIDSERNSVFLNTTNILLSELTNYNLQLAVLESELIPDDGAVSEKRFRILNMVFPSLIPAKSTVSSKEFLSAYQKKYNLLPSANIMLGFDITFDSLLRLIQQQGFNSSAKKDITEYTQLKFDYEKNNLGGFRNEGIYILQYDSASNIREAN
ncbi:LysM peptidoglycan-binding domain-containing protein [Gelidibacter sp. F63206]|uniref:LysM peptidoglycan-binding domain-containing protein n=1 Tax=Gelidibacter sp. F63206 TaxID=2926425 RepID=UPI001FF526A7|nr:LysM peptidoglycan-binding domain-containing protein [Gelidibacter sp. F63206]MCK0114676.1 LysM peptidoglycan-binding domain-containing protein [Gelidibacter sp. F63206]